MRPSSRSLAFHKMHGLGNDFVVIDARDRSVEMTEALARALANRRTGIGCDQLILLEPSDAADLTMRIFNADGGEVEACGNAARCVTQLVGDGAVIETAGGTISGRANSAGATLEMGEPRFDWDAIPLAYAMDPANMPVGWENLENPAAVNVGNPHIVFFVADAPAIDLARLGPIIENDPLFPERINVNVATIEPDGSITLRVWERGAGLTRACGTGACATMVAAVQRKLVDGETVVHLPGGDLKIEWAPGRTIRMTGPATHVFSGEIDTEKLL
ncbi:diaminopimelate epimerase [Parasphingopyxis algicola]|uniref:diaminopimelate epimerase n=1 Tax=Parasphingopyxis algicola TaxID=2026624 RepID=UPI0015A4EEDA|nr:diaminopimelate epimerase [Parasphingopyxis algicola]QLC24289.1 diaminopimelate epimerase [Parasphingopyxis algicola]